MGRVIEKKGFGSRKIVFFQEQEPSGEYSFVDGEWVWIRGR